MWSHNKSAVGGRTSYLRAINSACNSERMVKIGAELPKLSQKIKLGIRFLEHPVYYA